MNPMMTSMATIAISTIYSLWYNYRVSRDRRHELLRERVAFMLWQMSKRVG